MCVEKIGHNNYLHLHLVINQTASWIVQNVLQLDKKLERPMFNLSVI